MRTRTGKRVARCTQSSERCTSGRSLRRFPDQAFIRRHAETDAFDHALKFAARPGHQVNVHWRASLNVPQVRLAEIRDHPPGACIDQRECLLTNMGVGTFGNAQIGYTGVEGRIYIAAFEIVFRIFHRCFTSLSLAD